ncbi:hypothetical protein RhiXN_07095 [Rhizoctonia solani]|uniref:Peptidase A2 domain-containing protein n=1 Tax=Rhizoctonia solani TaxID=456999 RepID=A0A8H8P790_9AGAM|nr:uncharacterized protein RhiXN_10436 [Rhizoctonia solani]XP_043185383.1 uncharacterized protein RhiXN_07095 [Rhizoctonia solani]QRW24112.1 hypothetical protein RhiXN_10436 [Rhizoctonia solani]QRW25146.1 hypothetical protein RhiXN_07095 [Rhizoctonia solani]
MHSYPVEPIRTLIDSRATLNFISPSIVKKFKVPKTLLKNPQVTRMLDGTISQTGCIWHQVQLAILANGQSHSIPSWHQGTIAFPEQVQIESEEADKNPLDGLPPHYHKFSRVFGEEEFKAFPPQREYDIAIDLIPNAKLSPRPIYGMTDAKSKTLKLHIDEELAMGKIRPSTSPTGGPVMFVKKVDEQSHGKTTTCQNLYQIGSLLGL